MGTREVYSGGIIPQTLVALTLDNTILDTEWTSNTRASNHMIGNSAMLTNIHEYIGPYSVFIGDEYPLPIVRIGESTIRQNVITHSLSLSLYSRCVVRPKSN